MREPIALERRVAVTIWRLATNVEYRTLGELFGLGCSTVGKIVLETGFDAKSGFPKVAGAIDGTHIPIIRPQGNATDYLNCKGYHSLVMQAVVDFLRCIKDCPTQLWATSSHSVSNCLHCG